MGQLILVFGGITMLIALCEKLISPVTRRLNIGEVASIALATVIVFASVVGYGHFASRSEAQSNTQAKAPFSATRR